MKINQAVIVCGGYGKRLGKITLKTPKPLIKVKKLTVLDYIIKNLARFGVNKVILLCHYKYEIFKKKSPPPPFHSNAFVVLVYLLVVVVVVSKDSITHRRERE